MKTIYLWQKISSGSFKNVCYKMCLQIIYIWIYKYMYKQ